MQLFTALGLPTGFRTTKDSYIEKRSAGLELRMLYDMSRSDAARYPRIVKDPSLLLTLGPLLKSGALDPPIAVVLCLRDDMTRAAASRVRRDMVWMAPPWEGPKIPHGTTMGDCTRIMLEWLAIHDPERVGARWSDFATGPAVTLSRPQVAHRIRYQERFLTNALGKLIQTCAAARIPVLPVRFPGLVDSFEVAGLDLHPLLDPIGVSPADLNAAWGSVMEPERVTLRVDAPPRTR